MRLGYQTNAAFTPDDYNMIYDTENERARFTSVKLFQTHGCRHTEADVERLRGVGVEHFLLRLGDSIYEPDANHDTKWRPEPEQYGEDCCRLIARFVKANVFEFQLDCEPNIIEAEQGFTPDDYARWLARVVGYMLSRKWHDGNDLDPRVRLGLPPMSMAVEHHPWEWYAPLKGIARRFHFLCTHPYWQSSRTGRENILAGPLRERWGGAIYEEIRDFMRIEGQPDMPQKATEWANSIHLKTQKINGFDYPVWNASQVDAFRREQYPIWLEFAQAAGYMEDCYFFTGPGSTDDWDGFKPSMAVARVMAAAVAILPGLQDQSEWLGVGRGEI